MGVTRNLDGTSESFFQIGLDNCQFGGHPDEIEILTPDRTNFAGLSANHLKLGNKVTSKTDPHSDPAIGDIWLNPNPSNSNQIPLWHWNGAYWLSPPQRWNISLNNSTGVLNYFPVEFPDCDVFITRFNATALFTAAQTNLLYWSFVLSRGGSTTSSTMISTLTSQQAGASMINSNTWTEFRDTPNLHIDLVATDTKRFQVNATRNNSSAGNAHLACSVIWCAARRNS